MKVQFIQDFPTILILILPEIKICNYQVRSYRRKSLVYLFLFKIYTIQIQFLHIPNRFLVQKLEVKVYIWVRVKF